jgi:macrolide-specific efflux system membrane fusion protein
MRNKKIKIILVFVVLGIAAFFWQFSLNHRQSVEEITKEISLTKGTIQRIVSTTGTVLPKNRLEIKPPVNGRIEQILVKEGEDLKTGQIIAWMSSTERAALLDAARGQSPDSLKYWQEVYKAIPLTSPIDGEVIVATTQPGQTITANDAVVVLSDRLIVRAQVDETDIGMVKVGQDAIITLDAYPETKIDAKVDHIYYESQTVNNVTIYNVDLLPNEVPAFFRSGMNATVNFIVEIKNDAWLLPVEAIHKEKGEDYVLVAKPGEKSGVKAPVKLGISNDKNVEILSGIESSDKIIVKEKKFILPAASTGTNPFMPFGQRKQAQKNGK